MDKNIFEQILSIQGEIKDLERRLSDGKDKTITDNVKGSSSEYPYIQHNFMISGIDYKKQNRDKKYRKMIRNKNTKLKKMIREAEYQLNNVKNSDIRQIIRHVYFDSKDYNQTAHEMNQNNPKGEYTADSIRMKLKRFFQKN